MNFKEALIAHLQGEKVEKKSDWSNGWVAFSKGLDEATFSQMADDEFGRRCEFRLAPHTIRVNGVEVVAGEVAGLNDEATFFTPSPHREEFFNEEVWDGAEFDHRNLARGLVYLNKEDAIARAKAMLLFSK